MLALTLGLLLSVLRCGDVGTAEYAVNKAYRDYYIATTVEKVQQDPHSGLPYFVAGTMPSGTSNTTGANGMVNAVQLFTSLTIMNGHLPIPVVVNNSKVKTYGDDWFLAAKKVLDLNNKKVKFNFDPKLMSLIMLRMFNMEISPDEIHVCTKLFSKSLTLDPNAPVFLQFQFREFSYGGKVHRVLWRPWRPGPASKIFNSSDTPLDSARLAARLIVFSMFALDREIYNKLQEAYRVLESIQPIGDSRFDAYVYEKMKQLQLTEEMFVKFPKYDDVVNLHIKCVQFGPRNIIQSWDKFHEDHDEYVPMKMMLAMMHAVA